jgi:hypothetical protein
MRPRPERAVLLAVGVLVGLVAVLAIRSRAGSVRWTLRGLVELQRLPPAAPLHPPPAPQRIAHGAGALDGRPTPNSLEALERNHARGVRWFEVDFLPDANGAWWAVHDWGQSAALRPPRLAEVLDWFGRHPDARLVTDTKGDSATLLRELAAVAPELRARIHPQLYRFEEYTAARAAGFGAPIFTTYRSAYPWWLVCRFVERAPLLAVTVTRDQVRDGCAALCGKVPLLTHTVNDSAEAAALARAGLAGVYTDDLLP